MSRSCALQASGLRAGPGVTSRSGTPCGVCSGEGAVSLKTLLPDLANWFPRKCSEPRPATRRRRRMSRCIARKGAKMRCRSAASGGPSLAETGSNWVDLGSIPGSKSAKIHDTPGKGYPLICCLGGFPLWVFWPSGPPSPQPPARHPRLRKPSWPPPTLAHTLSTKPPPATPIASRHVPAHPPINPVSTLYSILRSTLLRTRCLP